MRLTICHLAIDRAGCAGPDGRLGQDVDSCYVDAAGQSRVIIRIRVICKDIDFKLPARIIEDSHDDISFVL